MEYKLYSKYKNSGIEWLGKIPGGWKIWKFNFLYKSAMGETILKDDLIDDGNIPVYSATEKDDFFGFVNNAKVILEKGDLVITARGSIGFTKFVNRKSTTTQTTIYSKNISGGKIDDKFAWYFLTGLRKELFPFDQTAIPQLTVDQVKSNFIALPSRIKQIGIVDYLDKRIEKINTLIEKNKKLIQFLQEYRLSLINNVVTGKYKIANGKLIKSKQSELKDSGIPWLGMIPRGWEVKKLKYIGDSIIGIIYNPGDVVEGNNSGTLVLRASNVQNGKLSLKDNVYVDAKISSKHKLQEGDILICSRSGSGNLIGKNIRIDKRMVGNTFGTFMTVFRTSKSRFIYNFFNSQIFKSQAGLFLTSTINQLTIDTLNNFLITFPQTLNERDEIADYLDRETTKIDEVTKKIKNQIEKLQEFRQSLIGNVVTGKIKII